tara:strand:+ start:762 stop:1427 length:666 start_codon:yes stop_codon:yes gene_type:complete
MRELVQVIRDSWKGLDLQPYDTQMDEIKKDDLSIKNEMFKCDGLRRVHLETAKAGPLEIVHSVYWPDPHYNIPIFGCDIVSVNNIITAAIVDVSPIKGVTALNKDLSRISNSYTFKQRRAIPSWGDDVFSPFVQFVRLQDDSEKEQFIRIVKEYLEVYCALVNKSRKGRNWIKTMIRYNDQIWYAKCQRKNKKTMQVLTKWFDKEWAEVYINDVLFDIPKY